MRALTVRQPYAQAIVRGTKSVENRTRNTHYRGTLAIHAGAVLHEHFAHHQGDLPPLSAVVGTVRLVDAHEASTCGLSCLAGGGFAGGVDPADPGRLWAWHWVLAEPVELSEPIRNVRGALGFWTPGAEIMDTLTRLENR